MEQGRPEENLKCCRFKRPIVGSLVVMFIWFFLTGLTPAGAEDNKPSRSVVLQLRWHHQFQFAGYYAAKEKGFFKAQGLDVQILKGGSHVDTVGQVVSEMADFGVTNAEVLLARLKHNRPVVLVSSIFQHSPLAFITRQSSGIRDIQDLVGKQVKMAGLPVGIELHAAMLKHGVNINNIGVVKDNGRLDQLFDPDIHAHAIYLTNQPFYYIQKNIPYRLLRPSDYGVDFYGDSIITSEAFSKKYPETVVAFKTAAIAGWKYALTHKAELIDIIQEKYNSSKDRAHLEFEAQAIERFIIPDFVDIGHINPDRWDQIAKVFVQYNAIPQTYSLDGFIFQKADPPSYEWLWKALTVMVVSTVALAGVIVTLFVFNKRLNQEITEKEASQAALVDSEARLKAMVEKIHSGIVFCQATENGEDFEIKSLNTAAQIIENVSEADAVGQLFSKTFPYSLQSGLFSVLKRVYQNGSAEHLPTSYYIGNQIEGWRENYIYRLPSKEIAIVYNDETIRKKVEINRKHMDNINHIIINTSPGKQMLNDILDAMLNIFQTDRAWLMYPGDPRSDVFQIKVESNRPQWPGYGASEENRPMGPAIRQYIIDALNTDLPIVDDITTRKGPVDAVAEQYHILSSIQMAIYPKIDQPWILGMHRCESNHPWSNDEKQLFMTIGRRISDGLNTMLLVEKLQKANKTLLESEDQFLKIFHSSPIGIIMTNRDELKIININESFLKITGFNEYQVIGKTLGQGSFLFPETTAPDTEQFKLKEHLNQQDIEFFNSKKERREGRLSSQWVTINAKAFIIFTLEDITAYKKAEHEKQLAHQHAAEQEKYALIGKVAGKLAHDFNNILGAIMGNTELSLLECEDPEIEKTLTLVLDQSKKGSALTKNLVVFARDQEPLQDYFDINEKVNLVLSLLKKDLEGIGVTTYFSRDLPDFLGDPGMIENALVNLIHNAIHAMSKTRRPFLRINTMYKDDIIQINIEDNGCGIPKEHQSSVYTPAFTLKDNKDVIQAYDKSIKGTGYGLYNVKRIVEKHKGQIYFESGVNEGTRFTIDFPVIHKTLTLTEVEQLEQSIFYSEKRILIVEDEPAIYSVQEAILSNPPLSHRVDVAVNGQTALESLEWHQYDLISMDYMLPGGLDGMDLYNRIREKDPDIPILFVSGNLQFLESIDLLMTMDNRLEYLSKPTPNKTYIDTINAMLHPSQT